MIIKYVADLAAESGMTLSKVSLVDGLPLGCRDTFLLNMSRKEQIVSAIVYRADLENLENGVSCDRLEIRIRSALSRLRLMLESGSETSTA